MPEGPNNKFISNASFFFGMPVYGMVHLQITDAQNERYSVPLTSVHDIPSTDLMRLEMSGFQLYQNPFSFSFTDVKDQTNVLITTENQTLYMMDKFLEIDFRLPSQRIFGFGERQHEFMLGEGTWTMWAKGQDSIYDDGTGGKQSFGVHPFILVQGKNKGDFFGVFFRNSNAQSPFIKFNQDGTSTLSYITTGGQLEIFFFLHGDIKQIIQLYHRFIGTPYLPPFWALGWHQGSGKYETQDIVEDVIIQYNNNGMLFESIFLDTSYLQSTANFQVDKTKFQDLIGLSDQLHQINKRLVVQIKSSLQSEDKNDKYLKMAELNNCLIKSIVNPDINNGNLVTLVDNILSVFIDWFNSHGVKAVWYSGLLDLFEQSRFDGLELNQNEATTTCNGECISKSQQSLIKNKKLKNTFNEPWYYSFTNQDQISTFNLPFIPGYFFGGNLDNNTLSLNASHKSNGETEYNLHNLFGLKMSHITKQFLTDDKEFYYPDNRPFIISRSTFSGSGSSTSHAITNNYRSWNDLKYSISSIMNMNLFGISHSGADVCGFYGNFDEELCIRWIQLATYYPLARFNTDKNSQSSEPYLLKDKTKAKASMIDRYQYLRYIYTCLYEVSISGGTCFDPMFYYYPNDDTLFNNIESTFLVGGAIKVTPILQKGATYVNSYFPISGFWVNLYNYSEIIDASTKSVNVQLKDQLVVNAHLKPGSMIPFQDQNDLNINSTSSLVYGPISLIINRDLNGMAKGSLLLDGGLLQSEIDNKQFEYFKFQYSSNSINKFFAGGTMNTQSKYSLQKIIILNAQEQNAGGDLSQTDFACYVDFDLNIYELQISFDSIKQTLTLTPSSQSYPQVNFNSFKTIHFGQNSKDINLCDPNIYQYKLANSILPNLNSQTTTFQITSMAFQSVLPDLLVTLTLQSPTIVNIKWTYQNQTGKRIPFRIPNDIINPIITLNAKQSYLSNLVFISDNPFLITIKSLKGDKVLNFTGMIYDEYLNSVKTTLFFNPEIDYTGIFGLGERVQDQLQYPDGVYSMWAKDQSDPFEDGQPPGKNIYGTHPFYMYRSDSQSWIGVYSNNANAQDWYIKNDVQNYQADLTTISTGGITDIYVIVSYSPKQVISDYWNYIVGRPVLPPVYALGWNQCRWGYKTVDDLYNVVQQYQNNGIPLDVQWSDIDYLYDYRNFMFDTNRYAKLPDFVNYIHSLNIKYVPILDAGIAMRPWGNYPAYTQGLEMDIYIKANSENSNPFIGYVWPMEAVYPDWFNPNTQSWWLSNLVSLYNKIHFDGLWLDMNEADNFCNGACFQDQRASKTVLKNLKYVPTNRDLDERQIAVDAIHSNNVLEFDAHSLFGAYETLNTYQFFKNQQKRPFIIERSSFAGTGKYGSRWLGDNWSSVEYLQASITGIMMMNMFGFSLVGSDICGFRGNTSPELCARWTVIGAFFPFSRNHNSFGMIPQEPFAQQFQMQYEPELTYSQIMIQGIRNKYHLIRYYYTQMFMQSVYGTGPFFNPMFFQFPDDSNAFYDTHLNIMLGTALKLSVQTEKLNQNTTQFYFPGDKTYCNLFNHYDPCFTTEKGIYKTLSTKAYDFYIHLLVGNIVPMQNATLFKVNNTVDLQKLPVDFHILGQPDNEFELAWYAQGIYVNDNGINLPTIGNFNQYSITAKAELSDPQKITIYVDQVYLANNHYWVNIDCYAVNKNDILGSIYFYNAAKLQAIENYEVKAIMHDQTEKIVGEAKYNSETDQLILRATASLICLPSVRFLTFTKIN